MQRPYRYPSAFETLFITRRKFDELRLGLFRGLASWTAGEIEFAAVLPAIEAYEAGHNALIEQIFAHRNVEREAPADDALRDGPRLGMR